MRNLLILRNSRNDRNDPDASLRYTAGTRAATSAALIYATLEKIDRLRTAVSEEGSSAPTADAEVVDFALADCLAGVQEAEVHEIGQSRHGRGCD